ncbi:MAG: phospholipase D-like domain-containing protein [Polyangiaceae bacterium]
MTALFELGAYLVSHAFAVLTMLASLIMILRLLDTRRTQQSTVAWLLAIVFMPFVAIPLYLMFGARKFPRRAKGPGDGKRAIANRPKKKLDHEGNRQGSIADVLRASGVCPPRNGNTFEVLTTGEIAYVRLLDLISRSQKSIDLTMFILGDDATGNAMIDALAKRASQGVKVRVILDGVGCAESSRHATRTLGSAGGEVRIFMPLAHSPIRGRTNLRSHRKLAVFDDAHVFAGGMNLASEYMGVPLPEGSKQPRWRDVAAIASGPVAEDAHALFESDWRYCGGSERSFEKASSSESNKSKGAAILQLVASGPDMVTDTVYDLLLTGIFEARERIVIVTPYFVPDEVLQHALVLATRRSVTIDVLVPLKSNHRIADIARRKFLRELVAAGVHVHYYAHGMVHAKAMIVDDLFAYVGSPNFDMRSLFLNYEDALCVYSSAAIAEVREYADDLIAECMERGPHDRERWVIEQLARLLAPEL